MAAGPYSWSRTAASNGDADAGINLQEGQTPASLNDAGRGMMASLRGWIDGALGAIGTNGGSSNAYTYTNPSVAAWSSLADGNRVSIEANHTNTGAATLAVDGLDAKPICKGETTALAAGDLVQGARYDLVYDAGNDVFQLLGGVVANLQPLDATLTALAALSWSSGNALVQFTAADTVSLTLTPCVTDITTSGQVKVAAGSASAPGLAASGDTNTGIEIPGGDTLYSVVGGSRAWLLGNNLAAQNGGALRAGGGNAASPGISFANGTTHGLFNNSGVGVAVSGSQVALFQAALIDFQIATRAKPAKSSQTGGTLTSEAANKVVALSTAPTIDGNVFAADDFLLLYNDTASAMTVTQGSTGSPTQRLAGTATTGNLQLAARGYAFVRFKSATDWTAGGNLS